MSDREYYLGFSSFPGIGPHKFATLLDHFHSARDAWTASKTELQEAKLGEKTTEKFLAFRGSFDLENYERRLLREGVSFVILNDEEYPERLKQIPNPPFVLYVKGDKGLLNKNERDSGLGQNDEKKVLISLSQEIDPWIVTRDDSVEDTAVHPSTPLTLRSGKKYIAIVGTRRITSYGQTVTRLFTQSLVQNDCVIVSGLALGVDAVAHQTTIENKGETIAVLGCGVDCCSPRENEALYNSIISSGGAVISEYPLGAAPTIGSFPARNRIVAGLSDAVLVTEGAEDSGALITADFALEFGRKAFAIPGPITSSLSKGPFKLIAKGGKLVTSPEEMLEELGATKPQSSKAAKNIRGETAGEQKIIDLLSQESLRVDELIKRTGIGSSEIGAILSMMEIKGILATANGQYSIAHIDKS